MATASLLTVLIWIKGSYEQCLLTPDLMSPKYVCLTYSHSFKQYSLSLQLIFALHTYHSTVSLYEDNVQ